MPDRNAAALQIDHTHCRAICDEIGDRLRDVLGREASEIPPRLRALMDRLAQLEQSPSIAPSIDEMIFSIGGEPFAGVKRSADLAQLATNRESASADS